MLHELGILFPLHLATLASKSGVGEGEGNPWWIWIVVFATLAAFAGFVIWWWIYSPGASEKE